MSLRPPLHPSLSHIVGRVERWHRTRAIYHNGWMANTVPAVTPENGVRGPANRNYRDGQG
jgi:hypothetical protein